MINLFHFPLRLILQRDDLLLTCANKVCLTDMGLGWKFGHTGCPLLSELVQYKRSGSSALEQEQEEEEEAALRLDVRV